MACSLYIRAGTFNANPGRMVAGAQPSRRTDGAGARWNKAGPSPLLRRTRQALPGIHAPECMSVRLRRALTGRRWAICLIHARSPTQPCPPPVTTRSHWSDITCAIQRLSAAAGLPCLTVSSLKSVPKPPELWCATAVAFASMPRAMLSPRSRAACSTARATRRRQRCAMLPRGGRGDM